MIRYTSQHQIELFEFEHPFEEELDKNNRWVKLSKLLPWDRLAGIYSQSLSSERGRLCYRILSIHRNTVNHYVRLSRASGFELFKFMFT